MSDFNEAVPQCQAEAGDVIPAVGHGVKDAANLGGGGEREREIDFVQLIFKN